MTSRNNIKAVDDSIDNALDDFKRISREVSELEKTQWSEADTRLKVIDQILFDVLGWSKNDAAVEERAGTGYTDYTLRIGRSARLIVEAKKDAVSFDLFNRNSGYAYKLNGSVFNSAAKKAIEQAIFYSALKSSELACVTNGSEWIVFRANRLGDGQDTLDGKAFIFSSLSEIQNNFRIYYDLISRTSVDSLRYRGEFQRVEGAPVRDLSFLKAPRDPGSKRLLPRGEFSTDFDAIMASFFERLKGDQDADMIQKCFVVSPESDLAEEKLSRIADDLVDKLRRLNSDTGHELVELIEAAKIQHKNRFILLVGNKGAGKTTFIDRFFNFVLPSETAKEIVAIRVDVAHNAGDTAGVVQWLNQRMLEECEKSVFGGDTHADWDNYIGKMFFDEYKRWSSGTMSHLYQTDKTGFKIEFGRHIEKIRETQPHEYIKRLIRFIAKSHKKIPCLVLDNTDHFTIEFQEAVFQYARSLYESEFCVVIVPITDKTSWQLAKQGALQSFESEVLSLPVPESRRVIERRISYLLDKLQDEDHQRRGDYFLSRGIRLNVENIAGFAASLNKIFLEAEDTARWIGGLANHDVRRVLELTKDVIASPHIKLDQLVKAYIIGHLGSVPEYKIKQAIIKRKYDIYPVGEHSFVQNLFALSIEPATTPLLGVRILQFIRDATDKGKDNEYILVQEIYEYFTALGIHSSITERWLSEMLYTGLVLNYDPSVMEAGSGSRVQISPSGGIHLILATLDIDYCQIMKDVTPLRDRNVVEEIVQSYKDYKNKWAKSVKVFIKHLIMEDTVYCQVPEHTSYDGQRLIPKKLERLMRELERGVH